MSVSARGDTALLGAVSHGIVTMLSGVYLVLQLSDDGAEGRAGAAVRTRHPHGAMSRSAYRNYVGSVCQAQRLASPTISRRGSRGASGPPVVPHSRVSSPSDPRHG